MAKRDNLLRLLVAKDSLNDTERLISVLRNAGLAVRSTRVEGDEDLEQALAAQTQDLFLCAPGLNGLALETAVRRLQQADKDVALLVLTEEDDPELRREVMAMGAVDSVSKADSEHFRLVVLRELEHLRKRRRLRRAEAALEETERRCHALLDSSRDAIAYVHEGMHIYANTAYLEKFGVAAFEEIEGMPLLDLISGDDQPRFKEFLRRDGAGDDNAIDVAIRTGDNVDEISVHMCFQPATWDGEPATQIVMREQSSSADLEEKLANLSQRDLVTGLYNRRFFGEALDRVIGDASQAENGSRSGLLYLKADNLATVRESLGITTVDLVLSDIAGILRAHIEQADVAARYADDTFTVLLPGKGVHETLAVAEALRKAIEDHISESGNRTVTKTVSIGVVVLGDGITSGQQGINMAFEALEVARGEGGNRIHLHAAREQGETDAAAVWKTRLEDGLAGEGFHLVYQPFVSLIGDAKERYEARLRLTGDEGTPLNPGEFMPYADRHGLTPALDRWIIRHVLDALAARQTAGHETTAFVKVSSATLGDQEFAPFLAERVSQSGVPGSRLVFELNEPIAVTQLNQAKAFFKNIKEVGCGFALDRFGTGLNPFQLLKHLPADYLKLDPTLTAELSASEENRKRLKEVISMAHDMRKQIIAGYLEEASMLATLWQYQVDLVQGHFLQEPQAEMNYDFSGMVI